MVAVGAPLSTLTEPWRAAYCLPPATAFHDLEVLVLGNHALDLQEQVLLGPAAWGIAQKDDSNTTTDEFLQYQNMICIFA